ncbi:MAG: YbhB/YbcL family Raf kinase inhibitor-like protein [Candidatus Hadarchaeota archaeon]
MARRGCMKISSGAFSNGGNIPTRYTCDGSNVSPPISIEDVPAAAKSLALICDDPDAPMGVFVHWVVWNIPPNVTAIPEKVPMTGVVKSLGGAAQGVTDFGKIGYGGPCPPRGPPHRYYFKLYALDAKLELGAGASKEELEGAMEGHILAKTTLMGKYGR